MDRSDILGGRSMAGMEFDVVEIDDRPAIAFPEAPPGFESELVAVAADEFEIHGGQFEGARLSFALDESGTPMGTVGGLPILTRLDRPSAPPPGSGLTAPPLVVTEAVEARFHELLEEIESRPDGRVPNAELPTPPVTFVQWLMNRDAVIFHGSNRADIDEFEPVRASMELQDTGGRGNLGAVYGTHDGLWSMFFAIVDRQRLRGSIRNGVLRYGPAGRSIDLYRFSVHHECLEEQPFTTGALYLLPRDRFERLPFFPGGPASNEWVCHEPVRPLARLSIEPEDFPFLTEIGGHDDGPLIEFGRLGDEVYDRLVSALRTDSGFEIVTSADGELVRRFIESSSAFYPDVTRTATEVDDGIMISMTGPPAFIDAMTKRLAGHLT
ncbi:MAG: hypothetical protein OEQ47_13135 [Acidimicrobiia bacterium]|nr:hypothetical protein [Acidimicrobiia bacterium]